MGLFSKSSKKLQSGLSATKKAWTERLKKVVLGKSRVDADFLEALEEILITSDVGVATTEKIIARLEQRVAKDKFIKAEELDQLLYDEIFTLLFVLMRQLTYSSRLACAVNTNNQYNLQAVLIG